MEHMKKYMVKAETLEEQILVYMRSRPLTEWFDAERLMLACVNTAASLEQYQKALALLRARAQIAEAF